MDLELNDIQGNIVPGFSKDHQSYVFVRFQSKAEAAAWIAELQPEIASATEVAAFKEAFSSVKARRPHSNVPDGGALHHISAIWVNIALSFDGLRLLAPGVGSLARFPGVFRTNRVPGADPGASPGAVHALLIIAADHASDLDAELALQRARMAAHAVDEVMLLHGNTLPGAMRGYEHFGFKDGVSQPHVAGTPWGVGPPVAAGEFILGQRDQTGGLSGTGLPEWTQNGSYLGFLQLQQHVSAFWNSMKQQARQLGLSAEALAAAIVGREPDGTPVQKIPSRYSHIGRGYPRWLPEGEAQRHRIIRRGIPYGPQLAEDDADHRERGLFFITYQADIERQFEHVWRLWINGPNFPSPGAGRDALTGQLHDVAAAPAAAAGAGTVTTRPATAAQPGLSGGTLALRLPLFVTPRYGGYFFAPSISALTALSSTP